VYYVIKDFLNRQLDQRNKRTRKQDLFLIGITTTVAAFIAVPTPDTSYTPPTRTVVMAVQGDVEQGESFQESQARNFRLCEAALKEKAEQCEIKKDNTTCQKWMSHVQIGCDHYKTTWYERNQKVSK